MKNRDAQCMSMQARLGLQKLSPSIVSPDEVNQINDLYVLLNKDM